MRREWRIPNSLIFLTTLAIVATVLVPTTAGAQRAPDRLPALTSFTSEDIDNFEGVREALGFDVEATRLLTRSAEALSNLEQSGFLTTDDELVVLQRRQRLGDAASQLLPELSELPGYAGAELVHEADGRFVVSFADDTSIERSTELLADNGLAHVQTRRVQFSEDELVAAMENLWAETRALDVGGVLSSVSVDVTNNRLRVGVAETLEFPGRSADVLVIEGVESALRELEVPHSARFEPSDEDANCVSRGNCDTPTRAGIRIEKGSTDGADCTMGFHVRRGSDEQFLTSGHCGHTGSNSWYHDGLGFVGTELASTFISHRADVMRVQISNSQATGRVYLSSNFYKRVNGQKNTNQLYVGMPICNSGEQTGNRCGTITDVFSSWTSSTCSCTQWGADASYSTVGGDSGGAVTTSTNQSVVTKAVGVNATTGGRFVRIQTALAVLNVSLVHG